MRRPRAALWSLMVRILVLVRSTRNICSPNYSCELSYSIGIDLSLVYRRVISKNSTAHMIIALNSVRVASAWAYARFGHIQTLVHIYQCMRSTARKACWSSFFLNFLSELLLSLAAHLRLLLVHVIPAGVVQHIRVLIHWVFIRLLEFLEN